ncbi:MAG TPA: hypothetical protein VHC49_24740 [Mycobacteriales bacterium]|nr:hypothetical protein [Mycobacteriales bacterium]
MMARIRAFGAFWYDFIIGDDWRGAAAVVVGLALTYGLVKASVPAWWVMPLTVILVLPWSIRRARREN